MKKSLLILSMFLTPFLWLVSANATDFPKQKISIVVPFAAGGANDITARLVGEALSHELKAPIVIENRPGAGSVLGTEFVARAKPDGYTLLLGGLSAIALNPTVYKALPYDPRTDFVPLANVGEVPFVLVVNPALEAKSASELIAYAKANPRKLNMASAGSGSPHHLFGELLASVAGFAVTHVPYRGSQIAVNDVVAGHVDMMIADLPVAQSLIESGKLRALAVTTKRRVPNLPNVPTLDEAGVPGYEAAAWLLLLVPAKTPRSVIEALYSATNKALATPESRRRIEKLMIPGTSAPLPDLQEFVKAEIARWEKTINLAGLASSQ